MDIKVLNCEKVPALMIVCFMTMLLQAPELEPGTHLQNFP